jgi:two-component system, NarL family, response regulator DegU
MKKIRLLLIEDNRLLREVMTAMMKTQPDLKVVAACRSVEDFVSQAQKLNPHIVLLSSGLLDQNSLCVAEIRKKAPEAKMIVMAVVPAAVNVLASVKAGISGFILRQASRDEFVNTIRQVFNGAKVLPGQLIGSLFSQIAEDRVRNGIPQLTNVRMTKREREVVDLIGEGLSNKEIAQRLHLATYTIKSHVHNILEKMAVHTRLQIAACAHSGRFKSQADYIPPTNDDRPRFLLRQN